MQNVFFQLNIDGGFKKFSENHSRLLGSIKNRSGALPEKIDFDQKILIHTENLFF